MNQRKNLDFIKEQYNENMRGEMTMRKKVAISNTIQLFQKVTV